MGLNGQAELFTTPDGLRLLPSGRKNDAPWVNLREITITLSDRAKLSEANIRVTGVAIADYGR